MIEIFNIFYLTIGLTLIFLFPSKVIFNSLKNTNNNLFEILSINIILVLNLFLILSFLKLNLIYVFCIFAFLGLLNFILFYKSILIKKNYLFLIFLFFSIMLSFKIAVNPRMDWDASVIWIFKAKNFYDGFNFSNLSNVPGVVAYPHLGTYGWGLLWKNSLVDYEYTGRIFYIYIYLISIFFLVNRFNLSFITKIIAIFLLTILTFDHGLFSGYQEPLLFALIIILFETARKANSFNNLNIFHFLCILNANLILWVKNEGFVWLLIILIYFLIHKKYNSKIKVLYSLSFILLIVIKFLVFNLYFKESLIGWKGYEFIAISQIFSLEILQRLPVLIYQLIQVFFKYPIYLIFLLLNLYLLLIKKISYENKIYILLLVLNCGLSVSIFYFTTNPLWQFHASVGLDRMLYQTSGIYLFSILYIFNKYLIKIDKKDKI